MTLLGLIARAFSFTETELRQMPLRRMRFWQKRLEELHGLETAPPTH